jgi:hypothetical protein
VFDEAGIQLRYQVLDPVLEERSRHRFAAAEAKAAGRGGVNTVARITGMARSTIIRGLAELAVAFGDEATAKFAPSRLRAFACPASGRRPLETGADRPDVGKRRRLRDDDAVQRDRRRRSCSRRRRAPGSQHDADVVKVDTRGAHRALRRG